MEIKSWCLFVIQVFMMTEHSWLTHYCWHAVLFTLSLAQLTGHFREVEARHKVPRFHQQRYEKCSRYVHGGANEPPLSRPHAQLHLHGTSKRQYIQVPYFCGAPQDYPHLGKIIETT